MLHLHHPLLPSRHERTDLHRDAILWPPHAAPPPTGGFPASVSNGGQQAAEEVMLRARTVLAGNEKASDGNEATEAAHKGELFL